MFVVQYLSPEEIISTGFARAFDILVYFIAALCKAERKITISHYCHTISFRAGRHDPILIRHRFRKVPVFTQVPQAGVVFL